MTPPLPLLGFSFAVQFSGIGNGPDNAFTELSGLTTEFEIERMNEGGENRFAHQLPGQIKYTNLVLKRGIFQISSPLREWCVETFENGLSKRIEVRDLDVMLLDEEGNPAVVWSVSEAWPVKIETGAFHATENEVAVETLEFAYSRFERRDSG